MRFLLRPWRQRSTSVECRARPVLGRLFAPDEDQTDKAKVVVLTYEFWQNRFDKDLKISDIIGWNFFCE